MNKKHTVLSIKESKGKEPLVMITAYDALFAKLIEPYADIILVGDSLNMSFLGKPDTLSATLDQMIYHTNAVCNGAKNSFIVCDMPFGTYTSKEKALENSIKVYQKTFADAVKIEGGKDRAYIIEYLVKNGIAVVAHIGLLPQNFRAEGGYRVKGKDKEEIKRLLEDAKAIEAAGAFCVVIEGVRSQIAKEITNSINIPTIGIGAGVDTDGQVLVWSDLLGFFEEFKPKFVKRYLEGAKLVKDALNNFKNEVKSKEFPSKKYFY